MKKLIFLSVTAMCFLSLLSFTTCVEDDGETDPMALLGLLGGGIDCADNDGDGYGTGSECLGADCDDGNANVNPGRTELCSNGIDDDCDGTINEGCPPSCSDTIRNGDETGVDCGGSCSPCPAGEMCVLGVDCISLVCSGENICLAPTCSDTVFNGNETGTDCGGSDCSPCSAGEGCLTGSDCQSGSCVSNICQ